MTAETITVNEDPVASCDHEKQLDHIDEMCHRIIQVLDELEPHIPRLRAMLNPGAAMRAKLRGKADG